MATLTTYFADSILDLFLGASDKYIGLHTSNPTASGDSSTEVVGGSYARQLTLHTDAGSGTTANDRALVYTNMPACVVKYIAVWELVTSGNMLLYLPTPSDITVTAGQTLTISANAIGWTLT